MKASLKNKVAFWFMVLGVSLLALPVFINQEKESEFRTWNAYSDLKDSFESFEQQDLLARAIWGEARGEPLKGKLAVAHVVLNRLKEPGRYGESLVEVILRPKQFSCFNEGDPNRPLLENPPKDDKWIECALVASLALAKLTQDPTGGATHYFADSIKAPTWSRRMEHTADIGNHLFFKES